MKHGTYFSIVLRRITFYIYTYTSVQLERQINTGVYSIYMTFSSEWFL